MTTEVRSDYLTLTQPESRLRERPGQQRRPLKRVRHRLSGSRSAARAGCTLKPSRSHPALITNLSACSQPRPSAAPKACVPAARECLSAGADDGARRRQSRNRSTMAVGAVLVPVRARSPHRLSEAVVQHRGGGLAAVARPSRRGRGRPGQRQASRHGCALRRNRRQPPQECPGRRRPPRRHLVRADATGSRPAGRHRRV